MFNTSTFNPSTMLDVVEARHRQLVHLSSKRAGKLGIEARMDAFLNGDDCPACASKRAIAPAAGFWRRVGLKAQKGFHAILRRRNQGRVQPSNG